MPNINPEVFKHLLKESDNLVRTRSEIWQHQPLPLQEFVREHLRLPPLTPRQYQELITFLGEDSSKVFDNGSPYNLICILAGKGSGKDYIASVAVTYCFYLLMCMKDPQAYFGFPTGEPIDIIIISYSAEQAKRITFEKIKQRFKYWKWLRANYTVVWGEKFVSEKGKPEVFVLGDSICSHNNVRIYSEHSANESFEGYNILFWVMSESSAFKAQNKERNGQKVYDTLKSSANSRFPGKWKGMVISFPRYEKDVDFTYALYEEALKGKDVVTDKDGNVTKCSIWGTKGTSWEFNPTRWKSGVTFKLGSLGSHVPEDLADVEVPIELKESFESDFSTCMRLYLCEPPSGATRVLPDDVLIRAVHGQSPLIVGEQFVSGGKICMKLHGLDPKNKDRFKEDYLLTTDLGESFAATAMVLQHYDSNVGYIQDAFWTWTPNVEKGIPVDFDNVRETLFLIAAFVPHIKFGFDQWQSKLFMADLHKRGAKTEEYHTTDRDYGIFRRAMAMNIAKIINPARDPSFMNQLKAIKQRDGVTFLDKKISERKDIVDATVGGFNVLIDKSMTTSNLPGTVITSNLAEFGTLIQEA
jgi:hypothetical protein